MHRLKKAIKRQSFESETPLETVIKITPLEWLKNKI